MNQPFVVVGAGVAGMTAALLLARRGERVVLVEAAPHCAPLIRGFRRHGILFDTGFHYAGGLGSGEPLERMLIHLGLRPALTILPFAEKGFDRCRLRGEPDEFVFPVGEDRLAAALGQRFPREQAGIVSFLQQVAAGWQAFPYLNLEAPVAGAPLELLDAPSLQQVLDATVADPRLRGLLSLHCLLHGAAADEIPFALHACVAGPYYRSTHGIVGGGAALAKAFETQLAAAGVELRLGTAVTGIDCSASGRIRGVRLQDGDTISCRGCVATIHPRLLLSLVPDGVLRPAYRKRLERLEESAGGLVAFARTRVPLPQLQHSNLFLLHNASGAGRLVAEAPTVGPLYLAAAPDGAAGFQLISPLALNEVAVWQEMRNGERPEEYRVFKVDLLARLQARLREEAPEIEAEIIDLVGATPLTYRDYVTTPCGSLYGVKHRVGQVNPQPSTRIEGLWLAGQATAAPGVLGAMLSSYLACGTIFGHEPLREELKRCA